MKKVRRTYLRFERTSEQKPLSYVHYVGSYRKGGRDFHRCDKPLEESEDLILERASKLSFLRLTKDKKRIIRIKGEEITPNKNFESKGMYFVKYTKNDERLADGIIGVGDQCTAEIKNNRKYARVALKAYMLASVLSRSELCEIRIELIEKKVGEEEFNRLVAVLGEDPLTFAVYFSEEYWWPR